MHIDYLDLPHLVIDYFYHAKFFTYKVAELIFIHDNIYYSLADCLDVIQI